MTTQSTVKKTVDAAHGVAGGALNSANDALHATREAVNTVLDKAELRVRRMNDELPRAVDGLAARTQDLATRGIAYCSETGERARSRINHATKAASRYVAEQPGKSVLFAAATGVAAAALLLMAARRRRSDD